MKNTLETRLGLFFALTIIAAVIVLELAGDTDLFRRGIHVTAAFDGVQELKLGDPVKMAGVQIGRVDGIEIVTNRVEVRMRLDAAKAKQVRTTSKAAIRFLGLMGQNYVAIQFGAPEGSPIGDGGNLSTEQLADLSSLMTKLEGVATGVEAMTKSLSGDNFANLLGPFTDFFKENRPKLTAILGNVQNISDTVARGQGTMGRLINDETLYRTSLDTVSNFNRTATDVQAAVTDAKAMVAGLNAGQGTLGRLAKDETLYKEATAAVTNLKEIFQKINQGQGSVGKLVNDESLYRNARVTLEKLDKATEGLEDQGPLSVLGMAVNRLF